MIFRIVFLILALVSIGCLVMAATAKRRNIGYMVTAFLVAASDVVCFFLLDTKSIGSARTILSIYYICYTWLFLGVLWTLSKMGRHRHYLLYSLPVLLVCVYQTVLMAGNWFGKRIISPAKHILLGKTWWLAQGSRTSSVLFSLNAYRVLLLVNTLIILGVMVACFIHTTKIFRGKFIAFIGVQILLTGTEIATDIFQWPLWIQCLVMNLCCIFSLYFIKYYSDQKLKNWSLISFANEMSDGFVLYNEYDDLIHMNDLLKKTIPAELLDSFKDKGQLDTWISHTTNIDNIEVLTCETGEREIYFKVKKTALGAADASLGTIYIFHDTTESILQMRVMEKANRELERAAKMKSDFLANMSHELRTPMNAVIGMAEIAMREKLPPHVLDYLTQIQHSGRNLLNIINDILDFSKIEAGKMEIFPERYEPLSEINDVANVLVTRIGDKKLELFVTSDTNIPRALEGDAMRIRQVLINLANNAIKFTQEGTVHIQIFCEKIAEDEVMLTYHVIDTGSGIKPEDMDKLFVSFQQVDSKRNRSVEGTGLGLAISQRLCEAMGGTIGVTSEYGKGSDFYFSIPQKVLDPESDIAVEDADKKHAFCLCDNDRMVDMFTAEMDKLGVDSRIIHSLEEYQPTGQKDYLFLEEQDYGETVVRLLDSHPECMGIILVNFDSDFVPKQPNLHVMRRPETTLSMVAILNDKDLEQVSQETGGAFVIDFVAPDARILIVDDNAINITIAEGLLQPLQAKCDSALSGKEAIEKIKENGYDIVLMDHMMPELDGIETTKVIRETIPSAEKLPILAVTANVMEGVKDMFLKAGMDDFVAKPIDVRDLVAKVKQWLPESKMISGEEAQAVIDAAANAVPKDEAAGDAAEIVYEGLDCENAVKSLGSPALFRKIVQEYYRSGEAKYAGIKSAYDSEDWKDYTIKVHALKSSSRQIGAPVLGDMAEELEKAGNALDLDVIHGKTADLLEAYRELLDQLSGYFVEESDGRDLPEIAPKELKRILQELETACEDLDMDGMESAKEALKQYSFPETIQAAINELYEAIDNIDIDACAELIGQISI